MAYQFSPRSSGNMFGGVAAKTDARVGCAAHLDSAAIRLEDRWPDIDPTLCLVSHADFAQVVADWTTSSYRNHAAVANYHAR